MNYRKSVIGLMIAIPVFLAANYFIWTNYTEALLTNRHGSGGDLSRIGYVLDSKQPRHAFVDLPRRHIEFREYKGQPVDMINIGDSFANGGGEGRNNFYPDYIATNSNLTVLNLGIYGKNPIETVMMLLNSGLLDKIKPRYVLIESVERFCALRFSGEIDFNVTKGEEELVKHYSTYVDLFNYLPKLNFVNNGNIKYVYYRFLYLFSDSPTKKVKIMQLTKPLFNVKNEDKLLVFSDEYRDTHKLNRQTIKALNDNMNKLAEILAKKNIQLYFMPPPDKYNLYNEFILNNPYPKSVFFEELRPLPKKYHFIDTKEILLEAVRRGEKDVYYADDTHWSWKAPEIIFDRVRFE